MLTLNFDEIEFVSGGASTGGLPTPSTGMALAMQAQANQLNQKAMQAAIPPTIALGLEMGGTALTMLASDGLAAIPKAFEAVGAVAHTIGNVLSTFFDSEEDDN
jgi:hypothetical protein